MKLSIFVFYGLIICLFPTAVHGVYAQNVLANKEFYYQVTLPASLTVEYDSAYNDFSPAYYDENAGIVLMISARKSVFTDVKSYLDCSRKDLERDLQNLQGDSTLKLVECRKSHYYSDQAVLLHFETTAYSQHLDRCLIYFFHHRGGEIQFFFLYDKTRYKESLDYIDSIMQSLRLE